MTEAVFDVGVDVAARFDAAVGRLEQALATQFQRQEQSRLALIPNSVTFEGLLAPGAATTALWDVGTPPMGRKWEVRLWTVDAQPDGSNTGNFLLLVGNPTVQSQVGILTTGFPAAAIITNQMRWRFNAAPNFKDFSGSQIVVRYGQHLMVATLGAPAATNVNFALSVDDMLDQSSRGGVSLV